MLAIRLTMIFLLSIIGIALAENPAKRETHLQPPLSWYPEPPALSYTPGNLLEGKLQHRRHRRRKIHHRPNPIKFKESRRPERPNKLRRKPNRVYSGEKWSIGVEKKNVRYSDVPFAYLEPPKALKSTYELYSPRKVPEIVSDSPPTTDNLHNHRLHADSDEEGEDRERPTYIRDHAPEQQVDATDDIETDDDAETSREKSSSTPESPKERIEFHIQGHEGPQSYIFGFDTGAGSNRQFRLEERHEDGSVTGHYGYMDARGLLRKVHYKASPTQGYLEKPVSAHEEKI